MQYSTKQFPLCCDILPVFLTHCRHIITTKGGYIVMHNSSSRLHRSRHLLYKVLFILTAAATIYGIRRRTGLWGIDLVLFGIAGIVGCVLAFLALFSQHPAVSSNFLLLVFHPGQLLFLPYIVYCVRKGKKCWYLTLNLVVLTLFIVLFPVIPQRFDFAVVPLALVLLIRSASNLIVTSKKK